MSIPITMDFHHGLLEAEGWITAEWKVSDGGRRARYYGLTPSGRRQLARERASWDEFVAAVTRLIETPS